MTTTYPKEIYAKIKPILTKDEALERAKKRKPKFQQKRISVKGSTVGAVIKSLEAIKTEYGDVRVEGSYYHSGIRAVVKTQITDAEIAEDIIRADRTRYQNARYDAQDKYDTKRYEASRVAEAAMNTHKCKCCCCS